MFLFIHSQLFFVLQFKGERQKLLVRETEGFGQGLMFLQPVWAFPDNTWTGASFSPFSEKQIYFKRGRHFITVLQPFL